MQICLQAMIGFAALGIALSGAAAENPINDTRATLERWVEVRQLIGQTKADWQADRELMEQTIELYERELKSIGLQMSQVSTNNTQVEKERLEAESLQKSAQDALKWVKGFAADFQHQLQQLAPRFPAPLQEKLKKDLARLPAEPATSKMLPAEQMQILVGLLNEIDKFNNSLNVFSERRRNERNEEIAVETLYIGLGAAYFVNDAGDFAGTGTPGAQGWEWTIQPELAKAVKETLQIYRNERTAQFVTLPVRIR